MTEKAEIFYKDIGDYLSREEKLRIVSRAGSILRLLPEMTRLTPNEHDDWISQRNDAFSNFIPIDPENKFGMNTHSFFTTYSLGIATNKDAWLYNFSRNNLEANVRKMVNFYNNQRIAYHRLPEKKKKAAKECVTYDNGKITWTDMFLKDLENDIVYKFISDKICNSLYRPFTKTGFCYEKQFIQRTYQQLKLFPNSEIENIVICVHGLGGKKDFSCIITDCIPDLNSLEAGSQCFPLYWYEKKEKVQGGLFEKVEGEYNRRDGVSDFILDQAQTRYGPRVAKEDIFYYVYGILHSPDYRKTFANDLKKTLPRLPLVEKTADFWAFSEAGRKLAALHLNYETLPSCPDVTVSGVESGFYLVEQMRFATYKHDGKIKRDGTVKYDGKKKDAIIYNSKITITNIPAKAYEYVVNGKSAIEWIMERYAVTTHKESGITNDPNDWAKEHNTPRYILDLLLSVITISVKTVDIVAGLPKVEWK